MLKKNSIRFFQIAIYFLGFGVLAILIWFPLSEGRATKLNLITIYFDPFILFGYFTSIAFFVALFKTFILLGYIGQNKLYSSKSLAAINSIKSCSIVLSILIAIMAFYVKLFHKDEDDPVGFLAICLLTIIIFFLIAIVASKFGKKLKKTTDTDFKNTGTT